MRVVHIIFVIVLAACSGAPRAETLEVGVKPAPPFVIVDEKTGEVSGFSVDLVRELAAALEPPRTVKFRVDPDLLSHLDAVKSGKVDLGISATSVTEERERVLDFSHPFYRGGLGIMVPVRGTRSGLLRIIFSRGVALVVLGVIVYLVVCGMLVWLAERGSPSFDDRWLPGIAQGIWWTIVTMSTVGYGDFVPRKPLGRVLGVVVIFSGIGLFGWAIAFFTSTLAAERLGGAVSGPADLAGRRVVVINGTVGERAVSRMMTQTVRVSGIEEGAALVVDGEADALVHDAPILRYYIRSEGTGRFVLAPQEFEARSYAIVFPPGSRLREEVNVALLKLMEGEESIHGKLHEEWFGK